MRLAATRLSSSTVCRRSVAATTIPPPPSSFYSTSIFTSNKRPTTRVHKLSFVLPTLLFSLTRSFSLPQHNLPRSFLSMSVARPTMETLQVKRLSQNAVLPVRGSEWAAGYDISSAEDTVVPAGGKALVKTDLSIAIPENTYARIAPRSGLAWKKHIDVGAGVIDYDYRGPVGVVLFNHGKEDFAVAKGDRVAQLILERICMAPVVEVEELSETSRGAGGFGSTGVSGNVENNNEAKRMKADGGAMEVEAASGAAAQLLVMLAEVAKAFPTEEAFVKGLKPLALAEDRRLVAAMGAYRANKDMADLKDTLRLINPSEQ